MDIECGATDTGLHCAVAVCVQPGSAALVLLPRSALIVLLRWARRY